MITADHSGTPTVVIPTVPRHRSSKAVPSLGARPMLGSLAETGVPVLGIEASAEAIIEGANIQLQTVGVHKGGFGPSLSDYILTVCIYIYTIHTH